MVAAALRQRAHPVDREADGCREVIVPAEEAVPGVRARVAEVELVPVLAHLLAQVLLEHGVVVITDHQHGQSLAQLLQLGQRGADLVTAQRVERGEGSGMERRDDDIAVLVDIVQSHAQHPLFGGFEHAVVHRLLQGHRPHVVEAERVLAVIDRQAQAVARRRVGELQSADGLGHVCRVAFLQTQHIGAVSLGECGEFARSAVFTQVVRDDLHTAPQPRTARFRVGVVGLIT